MPTKPDQARVKRRLDDPNVMNPAARRATEHLFTAYLTYEYRRKRFDRHLLARNFDAIRHETHLTADFLVVPAHFPQQGRLVVLVHGPILARSESAAL